MGFHPKLSKDAFPVINQVEVPFRIASDVWTIRYPRLKQTHRIKKYLGY